MCPFIAGPNTRYRVVYATDNLYGLSEPGIAIPRRDHISFSVDIPANCCERFSGITGFGLHSTCYNKLEDELRHLSEAEFLYKTLMAFSKAERIFTKEWVKAIGAGGRATVKACDNTQ